MKEQKQQTQQSQVQQSLKAKAIIFGASQSGSSAFDKLSSEYHILAYADNSVEKAGSKLKGVPVIVPADILSFNPDKVFIASEFFEQIQKQLVNELGLSEDKVQVLPTSYIKPISMGDSEQTLKTAEQILFTVCDSLEKNQVPYHVDAGTLLGIYRDGGLIPWDDDLDIAVSSEFTQQAKQALLNCLARLQEITGESWLVVEHQANQDFGAVSIGDVRGLKLKCENDSAGLPMLDIFLKYIDGDTMDYVLSSRGIRMPSCHLQETARFEFKGKVLSIPSDVEGYLERHYGDWRTPVKDWHLGMLKNATVFE